MEQRKSTDTNDSLWEKFNSWNRDAYYDLLV